MLKYLLGIGVISVLVIGVVIYSFSLTGSPLDARGEKFDQKRSQDFQLISIQIQSFFSGKHVLPESLSDIDNPNFNDPESGSPYIYQKKDETGYQLCATFSTSSGNSSGTKERISSFSVNETFNHPKGYYCFDYTVKDYNVNYNKD